MTPNKEDYLKLIFEIGGDTELVSNKQIVAGCMSLLPRSVR